MPRSRTLEVGLVLLFGVPLLAVLAWLWASRIPHPYDLEWMEGGVLAHAWRLRQGLPLYVVEDDWLPLATAPGYPALLAALPVGLSLSLGRAVSLLGALAAAGALVWRVSRDGGRPEVAFGTAMVFLGTYWPAGAFFDLCRASAPGVGLLAWSLALALEDRRGASVASGLLLAAAFALELPLGLFAFPVVAGLAVRGWRPALGFAVGAGLPIVGLTALWNARTAGAFATFALEVPASHELHTWNALVVAPWDWGRALPVALVAGAVGLVWLAMHRQRQLPTWLAAGLPVWAGLLAAGVGIGFDRGGNGSGTFAVVTGAVAVGLWWSAVAPSWRAALGVGVVTCATLLAAGMRAHSGGFVDVHLPLYWCVALGLGTGAARLGPWGGVLIAAQLAWSLVHLPIAELVPTDADVAAGDALVEELRGVDGPVLSPFGSWLPTYAGKPPSLHAMALWDLRYRSGPLVAAVHGFDAAAADRHWSVVVGGTQELMPSISAHYAPVDPPAGSVDTMVPRTGWIAHPTHLMRPTRVPSP